MHRQFQIVDMGSPDLLVKAHVKAHFRRDAKTGKLIFIQNYDSKVHGKADHHVHAGTKMVVHNPKSKHHGKTAVIRGYHVPTKGKRKPYVAATVDGVRTDLKPHHFKHVGDGKKSAPAKKAAPVKRTPKPKAQAPNPQAPPATGTITKMIEAKAKLKLMGKAFASPDIKRETKRIHSMNSIEMKEYIDNSKSPQKLYDLLRAAEIDKSINSTSKKALVDRLKAKLIQMANDNTQKAPKQAKKAPPTKKRTPSAQKPATGAATAVQVGDVVEIQTGKYKGKKGKITHLGDKYGVRVRVDLDGSGNYTKIAEYKKPHVSFKVNGQAQAAPGTTPAVPAGPKSDKTRGKDKKKRKTRSDKGTGKPDDDPKLVVTPKPKDPFAGKTMLDFANDRDKAYHVAPASHKDVAKGCGILPLDEDTRKMMDKAMHKMVKYFKSGNKKTSVSGPNASKLPKWAQRDYTNNFSDALGEVFGATTARPGYDASDDSKMFKTLLEKSEAEWKAAGYDYKDDVKPVIDKMKERLPKHVDAIGTARVPEVLNTVLASFGRIHRPKDIDAGHVWSRDEDFDARMQKKGYTIDTPLSKIVADPDFKAELSQVGGDKVSSFASSVAGISGHKKDVTPRELINGILDAKEAYKKGDFSKTQRIDDEITTNHHVHAHNKHINDLGASSYNRSTAVISGFNDAVSGWKSGNHSWSGDSAHVLGHIVGRKVANRSNTNGSDWRHGDAEIFKSKEYLMKRIVGQHASAELQTAGNKHFFQNFIANSIAREASQRYNQAGDYKETLFDKDLKKDLGHRYAGLSAGRRKKDTEFNALAMAKKYVNARKKRKHLPDPKPSTVAGPSPAKATLRKVDDKVHKKVVDRIIKHWDNQSHGGFKPKVHGVYEVGGSVVYDEFKKILDKDNNAQFAYHGTGTGAAANIIRDKFRLDRVAAGRMLGDGVYVAKCPSKASQYISIEDSGWMRRKGHRGVMFLTKCSFGKVHDKAYSADNNGKKTSHKGNHGDINTANTIFGPKGKTVPGYGSPLVNSEHCVKRPEAVLPMYWIDMELV